MFPFFDGWILLILLLTPIVTSLVLVMAVLPGKSIGRKALFHLIVMPLLFLLSVLWFRNVANPFAGYSFFACFIILFFLYLKAMAAIRWFRNRSAI